MRSCDDLVYAVYDAALAPERWPAVLSRIGAAFDAEGATIIFYSGVAQAEFIASPELAPMIEVYLKEEWWRRDIHAQRAIESHMTSGDVLDDFGIATPEEIETLPIYADFFSRVGLGWIMSSVMLPDLDMFVGLTVPRAKRKGPYGPEEIERLRALGRHVEQSLRLSLRIANLELAQGVALRALAELETGVYALDADGRLVFENPAGQAQFSDLFAVVDGRVTTLDPAAHPRFAALIDAAREPEAAEPHPPSCLLVGADGRRVVVAALPLTEASRQRIGARAQTLVLTTPVARGRMVDPALLRDIFGLSLGEARLASLIGGGLAVRAAAGRLGVAESTARIVLKRVFRKLGVNRQAELVLQVSTLGGAAPLPGRDED